VPETRVVQSVSVTHGELVLMGRVLIAFGLAYAIGFERELRGSPAGDRTYAMVGTGAAAIVAVTYRISPQAVGGVVTGIGFIGGGLVFREGTRNIRGITSAATMLAVTGIGIVSGTGHWFLAIMLAVVIMVDLEIRNIPVLNRLDARRYGHRLRDDMAPPMGMSPRPSGSDEGGPPTGGVPPLAS
jgi:putative Mg2+ transporter-C (MgtC) family protein